MLRPRLRIAILECDEPVGKTKEKYGGYGNLFKELLENGAIHLANTTSGKLVELEITKFDVVNKDIYPSLEDLDAVLLTGSSMIYPTSYTLRWRWLDGMRKLIAYRIQFLRQRPMDPATRRVHEGGPRARQGTLSRRVLRTSDHRTSDGRESGSE